MSVASTRERCGTETSTLQGIFSVIRRVKKSEAIEDTRLHLAAIPSEKGDLVRWRLGRIEFKQYEKYDGFELKVFPTSRARATSQRHT